MIEACHSAYCCSLLQFFLSYTNKPKALVVHKCYNLTNTTNICVNRVVIRPDENTGKYFRGRSGTARRSCGRGRSMGCLYLSSVSRITACGEKKTYSMPHTKCAVQIKKDLLMLSNERYHIISNERYHIQFLYFVFLSTRYLQRLYCGLSKYQIIRSITRKKNRFTQGINLLLIFYKENFHWSEILLNLFCRLLRCSNKKRSEAEPWWGFPYISPVTLARTPVANCTKLN
jgi:hypothetical protein